MSDERKSNDDTIDAPSGPGGGRTPSAPFQHLDLDTFNAYLDGGLSATDRTTAAAHLAHCGDCRREFAELRATVALLRALPHYAPRRSFRLGQEYAHGGRPIGGWFARLLPALPALRSATIGVAVLLLLVTAGDFMRERDSFQAALKMAEPDSPRQAAPTMSVLGRTREEQTSEATSIAIVLPTAAPAVAGQPSAARSGADGEGTTADSAASSNGEPALAAESGEAAKAASDDGATLAAAPAPSGGLTGSTLEEESGAGGVAMPADEAPAMAAEPKQIEADQAIGDETLPDAESIIATTPAGPESRAAGPVAMGAASASPPPASGIVVTQDQPETGGQTTASPLARTGARATENETEASPAPLRVSGWRVAQLGLGALLLGLIVGVVLLQRLQRRGK